MSFSQIKLMLDLIGLIEKNKLNIAPQKKIICLTFNLDNNRFTNFFLIEGYDAI